MNRNRHGFVRCVAVVSALGLGCSESAAIAEPTEAEKRAEAEAIFAQAKDLLEKRDFASACPKLEEVVKLQPRGIGAKITLADCYVGEGKLASAHAMLGEAASLAAEENQSDRATAAQGRAQELEGKLSKLTITIPNAIAQTPGLSVVRDGTQLSQALFNVTVPIDGGAHTIVATAPHMKPFEAKLEVPPESGAVTVNVVLVPEMPAPGAAMGAPTLGAGGQGGGPASGGSGGAPQGGSDARGTFWSPVRIGGIVVGGVGLVGLCAGIGVGATGAAKTGVAASNFTAAHARGDINGENAALQEHADGHNQAVGGWIVTGIGSAALVAGVVMMAAAPRGHEPSRSGIQALVPWAGRSDGGAMMLGRF